MPDQYEVLKRLKRALVLACVVGHRFPTLENEQALQMLYDIVDDPETVDGLCELLAKRGLVYLA